MHVATILKNLEAPDRGRRHKVRDEWVPSLVIYAPIIDFDWAVFVEDNQNNRSLLGESRVYCRFNE